MGNDEERDSKSLIVRYGLKLPRLLHRFHLLDNSYQRKQEAQQTGNDEWEAQWELLWIGLRTTIVLVMGTVILGIGWVVLDPSKQTILFGTLFAIAGSVAAALWTVDRIRNERRKQRVE